jgi:hypothetical protein
MEGGCEIAREDKLPSRDDNIMKHSAIDFEVVKARIYVIGVQTVSIS